MRLGSKRLLIIGCLCATVASIASALWFIQYNQDKDGVRADKNFINKVDEVVEEDIPINDKMLGILKEKKVGKSVGDLDSKESKNKSINKEDKEFDYHKPDINWSSGSLTEQEFTVMSNVASNLYAEQLNKVDKDRYKVLAEYPTKNEMKKFGNPALYYVNRDGVLSINRKWGIYDLQKETKKYVLKTISLEYELDEVKLCK